VGRKHPEPPTSGGFGALADALRARGLAPTPVAPAAEEVPPQPPPAPRVREPAAPAGVVVRRETKGRGGKTVTTIQRLPLRGDARDAWVTRLKNRLGTGASQDGDQIVVQGDHVARIQALLAEEGL
jgi:translation initiation factor 1